MKKINPHFDGKFVLVVDDEQEIREIIIDEFEFQGIKAIEASNGQDAFEMIKANDRICAVVSDVKMSNGDGIYLLERMREFDPEKPILIFITGFSELTESEALSKGAKAMFSKPFDTEQIVTKTIQFMSEGISV